MASPERPPREHARTPAVPRRRREGPERRTGGLAETRLLPARRRRRRGASGEPPGVRARDRGSMPPALHLAVRARERPSRLGSRLDIPARDRGSRPVLHGSDVVGLSRGSRGTRRRLDVVARVRRSRRRPDGRDNLARAGSSRRRRRLRPSVGGNGDRVPNRGVRDLAERREDTLGSRSRGSVRQPGSRRVIRRRLRSESGRNGLVRRLRHVTVDQAEAFLAEPPGLAPRTRLRPSVAHCPSVAHPEWWTCKKVWSGRVTVVRPLRAHLGPPLRPGRPLRSSARERLALARRRPRRMVGPRRRRRPVDRPVLPSHEHGRGGTRPAARGARSRGRTAPSPGPGPTRPGASPGGSDSRERDRPTLTPRRPAAARRARRA
jgi:hypothetical protein